MKTLTAFILSTVLVAHAEVKVTVGDITDNRTTGQFFAGLTLELKATGPELGECKGLRVVVKEAKDDAGKVIKQREDKFNEGGFAPPKKAFGGFDEKKANEYELKLELENPARSAKTLDLDAVVELLMPAKDPAAIITAEVAKEAGKPLANEALKTAGAVITLQPAKGDDLGYSISDPNKKIASVEFCAADGKPLETNGRMSSGFGGRKEITISLRDKPPANVVAKIYLLTDKSVVSVPVKLPGVTLP
jgi:hypothetical protein